MRWYDVLVPTGVGSAVLVAIAFLLKSIINHMLTADIETYKSRLQAENEVELARLNSDLQRVAAEHHVRFADLHARRARVIAAVYKHLTTVRRAARTLTSPFRADDRETIKKNADSLIDSHRAFIEYFEDHELYLTKDVSKLIAQFNSKIGYAYASFMTYPDRAAVGPENLKSALDTWHEAEDTIRQNVGHILEAIADEFRSLLGAEGIRPGVLAVPREAP